MSPTPQFPALEPSCYEWKRSSELPLKWKRRTLASECMWIPRPKECHEMFMSGSLNLASPLPYSALISAAKQAWLSLCFQIPELMVNAVCEKDGTYMHYQAPRDGHDAHQWVERTTLFEYGKERLSFQELRDKISQRRGERGCDSEQAALLIFAGVEDSDDLVEITDFILNIDHQITDGIGIRILLGQYLHLLANALSRLPIIEEEEINWQESGRNLSQPWIKILNDKQVTSGPDYEEMVEWSRKTLLEKMPCNPGLPLLQRSLAETQELHFITLTEAQSIRLLHTIKQIIGPKGNITHLGHAAMVIAMLRSSSLPESPLPNSRVLYSPCWLNGRRYLQHLPGQVAPTKSYFPICQSYAPIIFSQLESLTLPTSATRLEIKDVLVRACKVATAEYVKVKERNSMMPESVALMEFLGANMLERKLNPPGSPSIPSTGRSATADPFFLSDGLIEQYIDYVYFDKKSSPKRKAFEVNDIKFAANAEKHLIVRMSSWRGSTTILGEWIGSNYDHATIVAFLQDIVDIMLSILD